MRIKEESLDKALVAASLHTKGLPKRYTDGKDPFWIMVPEMGRTLWHW